MRMLDVVNLRERGYKRETKLLRKGFHKSGYMKTPILRDFMSIFSYVDVYQVHRLEESIRKRGGQAGASH